MKNQKISVVMLGASGAVGGFAFKNLIQQEEVQTISILGRSKIQNLAHDSKSINQYEIDVLNPNTYPSISSDHTVAICTLGIGEPSKVSREQFELIDKTAVLHFAKVCKKAGVKHFELLSSVSANANSKSWYLKVKGELIEELKALKFERLSIFQPSMILTPTNRYGFSQGVILKVWPLLSFLLVGPAKKFRGIKVDELGKAFVKNIFTTKNGLEILEWSDFKRLIK